MPLTNYAPPATAVSGNHLCAVVPAIASTALVPTLAELGTGVQFEGAVEQMTTAITANSTTRKKLSMTVAQKVPGAIEYSDISISFTLADPQAGTQALLDAFPQGTRVFIVERPGADPSTAFASGDYVFVAAGVVMTRSWDDRTTADGAEYTATVTIAPDAETDLFVAVTA